MSTDRERRRTRVFVVARRGRLEVGEPLFEPGGQISLQRGRKRISVGDIVLVDHRLAGAPRVVEVLGRSNRARDVVAALLADRGGERDFPGAAEDEAEAAVSSPVDDLPRTDLTHLPTFTVDPASARDFDDAVSAQRDGDGIRLRVHIADVSRYVRPGGAIDAEARLRANSTYVPGAVAPMLPLLLSDSACSLEPGVVRLAVTAELEIGADGEVGRVAFYRSSIRSDARLDYDQLDRVFAGSERAPEGVGEAIELARAVAAQLGRHRSPGALDVETSEPEFEFDDSGAVLSARAVAQTESHRLIERLMILVNEQVAELCERSSAHCLYRVHEQPDPDRIRRLFDQLSALDVPTPPLPDDIGPSQTAALAAEAARAVRKHARRTGSGSDALTSLVLRSLKPAQYSPKNRGHAGLGSNAYAHFTSPIRRYPDLLVHRALLEVVGAGERSPRRDEVADAGVHCSEREREAARIERDADSVCAAYLLERELFKGGPERSFAGEISGMVGSGVFVRFRGELADVYEGFLPARLIKGERFDLDQHEVAMVGGRTGRRVKLGDPVEVRVTGVEAPRGRVDLDIGERKGERSRG